MLPREMGCGSGTTCWRRSFVGRAPVCGRASMRPTERTPATWRTRSHPRPRRQRLAARPARGKKTGPTPTDRRKKGAKHHILTEARGIPLVACLTAANRNDITQLLPLVDAIPPRRGGRGRPRQRPDCIQGDRGYDSQGHRDQLRARSILPVLARRKTPTGADSGRRGGSSSAPWRGCTVSAASTSATNVVRWCTKPF